MEKLTLNEYEFLAQFERNYEAAIDKRYLIGVPFSDLERMNNIYKRVTNSSRTLRGYCGACVLELIQDVGRIYRREKDEREAEKAARSAKQTPNPTKVSNKTATSAKSKSAGRSARTNK